jgi:hypothetical protein
MKIIKVCVSLGLLWFVFYGSIPSIDLTPIPDKIDEVEAIVEIAKPSDDIIEKVKPVADLITNSEDRAKIALFNYEFSKRITGYNTDCQQVNDVYSNAGKYFFNESIKGKYPGLASGIEELLKSIIGEENHILNQQEKKSLQELFEGFSWQLLEK